MPESSTRPLRPRRRRTQAETGTPGFVAVGHVSAPWGVRGDLRVQPLTDFPQRFRPGAVLWLHSRRHEVTRSRWGRGFVYLALSGIDDRDAAEKLRDTLLEVPESDLAPLPEGRYYRFQVIGLEVRTSQGECLGRVADILSTPSNDVYVVRGGPKDLLLPAIEDVVIEVDVEGGRLIAEPPEEV